uniref:Calcium/calmodulin dependent protein kinase II inhibitor 1 n=1 Tax=Hucho hucho TaxID=62062 RepID=A0A4W5NPH5_9TELE
MSGVLPFNEKYSVDGDVGKVSITCRLQDTNNFYCAAQTKIPPKLGQIGRGKRVVIEDDRIEDKLKDPSEKTPAGV